jgi:hypothetical protein
MKGLRIRGTNRYGLGKAPLGLPVEGFTFGSFYGSGALAVQEQIALRFDVGYDRSEVFNDKATVSRRASSPSGSASSSRPGSRKTVSVVCGRVGATNFARVPAGFFSRWPAPPYSKVNDNARE